MAIVIGDITSTGASQTYTPAAGEFNVLIDFNDEGRGTVELQRKFTGGTWKTVSVDKQGNIAEYSRDVNFHMHEPETGVEYRIECTRYEGSAIHYRFGP